jgi:hypothetical protein
MQHYPCFPLRLGAFAGDPKNVFDHFWLAKEDLPQRRQDAKENFVKAKAHFDCQRDLLLNRSSARTMETVACDLKAGPRPH